jgi:hypothetical protein
LTVDSIRKKLSDGVRPSVMPDSDRTALAFDGERVSFARSSRRDVGHALVGGGLLLGFELRGLGGCDLVGDLVDLVGEGVDAVCAVASLFG